MDVRLREQDDGVRADGMPQPSLAEQKRRRWERGAWYYRWGDGERGADVYGRVESFMGSLHRHYQRRPEGPDAQAAEAEGAARSVVIVAHGIVLRLLLMRWLNLGIDWLHATRNPDHGELMLLQRVVKSAAGGPEGSWTIDRELCDHERNSSGVRTPRDRLAATVFFASTINDGSKSPRRENKRTGWLSQKLQTNSLTHSQMSVGERVAMYKPDILAIVDGELEKDQAAERELLQTVSRQLYLCFVRSFGQAHSKSPALLGAFVGLVFVRSFGQASKMGFGFGISGRARSWRRSARRSSGRR